MIDQAALDRYTFIRRAYLQRRQYLRVRRQAAATEGRRRMTIHAISIEAPVKRKRDAALAGVRTAAGVLRRRSPALAQEAPDALVKRVSQEALQIIKTDPKVQAGDQARIREVIETKLAAALRLRRG